MFAVSLKVRDSNKDKKLGYLKFPLKNIMAAPNMVIHRDFQMQESGPQSKLNMRLCLRVSDYVVTFSSFLAHLLELYGHSDLTKYSYFQNIRYFY